MKIGYFLSCEEWGPQDLIAQAVKAQEAGFEGLWISDHYHPWNDEQGHSPFVWSTIGAIAQAAPGMQITTAVTCPTIRIHPAVIAQAAATSAVMLDGNFCLGVGSGEALNEHILGDAWPEADERLEMLEEAVEVIRTLWQGGAQDHRGRHYRVAHARIYDLPDSPPPIIVSGFGPKAIELAGADRRRLLHGRARQRCRQAVPLQRAARGRSSRAASRCAGMPTRRAPGRRFTACGRTRVSPASSPRSCRRPSTSSRRAELVTEEMVAEDTPCGPDVDKHVEAITAYADAGFDELYVNQIGPRAGRVLRGLPQ